MLESLLGLLVFPICNALRYRQALASALVDPLTGAGNRGALDKALLRETDRARRYGQCLAIAMIDLDHFKRINDGCGHLRGDEVLCAIVESIRDDIRGSDTIYRYGGEEFVVLLPNTTAALAMRIAERLRCRVEALELSHNCHPVTTTVSIGVAMLKKSDSVGRLLERANAALYRTKSSGRNLVRLATGLETSLNREHTAYRHMRVRDRNLSYTSGASHPRGTALWAILNVPVHLAALPLPAPASPAIS